MAGSGTPATKVSDLYTSRRIQSAVLVSSIQYGYKFATLRRLTVRYLADLKLRVTPLFSKLGDVGMNIGEM